MVALGALMVTVLLAIIGGVWKLSSMHARVETALIDMRADLQALQGDRAAIVRIPDHERRIDVLENLMGPLPAKIQLLEHKLISIRAMSATPDPRKGGYPKFPRGGQEGDDDDE